MSEITPEFRAMRLLENLTPGGSEYFRDPERCAKWVEDRLSNAQRMTVDAIARRREAENALTALQQENARLRALTRTAWKLWAAIGDTVPSEHYGYVMMRAPADAVAAFMAAFKPSPKEEGTTP